MDDLQFEHKLKIAVVSHNFGQHGQNSVGVALAGSIFRSVHVRHFDSSSKAQTTHNWPQQKLGHMKT